jgi:TPR repeat protein
MLPSSTPHWDARGTMIARAALVAVVLSVFTQYAVACKCSEYKGPQPTPTTEAQAVLDQARALEGTNPRRAIALYEKSVKMKNGHAAKRLAEIYDKGIPGIQRDYATSLHWVNVAERLGVRMWNCSC